MTSDHADRMSWIDQPGDPTKKCHAHKTIKPLSNAIILSNRPTTEYHQSGPDHAVKLALVALLRFGRDTEN